MLNENCNFCPVFFENAESVRNNYKNIHNITDSNPVFNQCLENLSANSVVLLTSQCDFCNKFFYSNRSKAKHLVKKHLKL